MVLQLEISKLVCSLCKNEYVLENSTSSLTTQLCPECRSIIDTIRPVQRSSGALGQPGVNAPPRSTSPSNVYKPAPAPSAAGGLHVELPAAAHSPGAAPPDTNPLSGAPVTSEVRQPANGAGPYATAPDAAADNAGQDEWTLVVGEEKRGLWPFVKIAVVVGLMLACGAAGYLYFVRMKNKANAADQAARTAEQLKANTPKTDAAAKPGSESAPVSPKAHAGEQQQGVKPPVAESQAKEGPASTGKLVTLQAASFPNQAAANAFSEKLIKAGVPSYVIGVDIPNKGRWYRVRAGKFEKPEEARASIADWQKRASAAGVSIQLIVLDYEKP